MSRMTTTTMTAVQIPCSDYFGHEHSHQCSHLASGLKTQKYLILSPCKSQLFGGDAEIEPLNRTCNAREWDVSILRKHGALVERSCEKTVNLLLGSGVELSPTVRPQLFATGSLS